MRPDPALVDRLYRQANGARWDLPVAAFGEALEASSAKAFAGREASHSELTRYLASLHLDDLALACACSLGIDPAWEHFIREMRPVLYRAADALDRTGRARELADALYADLYGVEPRAGGRRSLLKYFHGRSSLATWLRAVLAQRHVDGARAARRLDPLDDCDPAVSEQPVDRECGPLVAALGGALERVLAGLDARERLRLGLYYAEQLTLAQVGRVMKEHEATASRHLARTRERLRRDVELELKARGFADAQVARCFECASRDAGPLDLEALLGARSS